HLGSGSDVDVVDLDQPGLGDERVERRRPAHRRARDAGRGAVLRGHRHEHLHLGAPSISVSLRCNIENCCAHGRPERTRAHVPNGPPQRGRMSLPGRCSGAVQWRLPRLLLTAAGHGGRMSRDAVIAEAERLVAPAGPGCFEPERVRDYARSTGRATEVPNEKRPPLSSTVVAYRTLA